MLPKQAWHVHIQLQLGLLTTSQNLLQTIKVICFLMALLQYLYISQRTKKCV